MVRSASSALVESSRGEGRLHEYVAACCDGFILNLDHERDGLVDRVQRFGTEVLPILRASSQSTSSR